MSLSTQSGYQLLFMEISTPNTNTASRRHWAFTTHNSLIVYPVSLSQPDRQATHRPSLKNINNYLAILIEVSKTEDPLYQRRMITDPQFLVKVFLQYIPDLGLCHALPYGCLYTGRGGHSCISRGGECLGSTTGLEYQVTPFVGLGKQGRKVWNIILQYFIKIKQ